MINIVPAGVLLDAAADLVEDVAGEACDVEGVQHRDRVGQSSAAAVLNPVKPSIATTSTASRQSVGTLGEPLLEGGFERPSTASAAVKAPCVMDPG